MAMTKAGRARKLRTAEKRLREAMAMMDQVIHASPIGAATYAEMQNMSALARAASDVQAAARTCAEVAS